MADLTPNNREEYWLKGMVDGQTTLEPNKRREYWYKEIVDAIGSGGGGGTGGGMTIIHASGSPLTLDKTYAEIHSALQGGIVMMSMEFMGMDATGLGCVAGEYDGVFAVGVCNLASGELIKFAAATQSDYPVVTE